MYTAAYKKNIYISRISSFLVSLDFGGAILTYLCMVTSLHS